jgi:hypothetical protein
LTSLQQPNPVRHLLKFESQIFDNFEKGNARGKNNTGEAGSAKGEDSVRGKLAIVKISLYDGNNNMPTVKDYTAYADVTGVNNLELSIATSRSTVSEPDLCLRPSMVFGWLPSVPFISLTSASIVAPTDGSVSFPRVILSTTSSLYYSICKGGSYTDGDLRTFTLLFYAVLFLVL